jgi:hypothetical protein
MTERLVGRWGAGALPGQPRGHDVGQIRQAARCEPAVDPGAPGR